MVECLTYFGIKHCTLGLVGDNASVNDKLVAEIEKILPADSLLGTSTQVRCFGHILNLVYQAIISQFEPKKKKKKKEQKKKTKKKKRKMKVVIEVIEKEEEEKEECDDPDLPPLDNGDLSADEEDEEDDAWEDDDALMAARRAEIREQEEEEVRLIAEACKLVKNLTKKEEKAGVLAHKKIIYLTTRVHNKIMLQVDLPHLCVAQKIKSKRLVKRARTRWNTMNKVVTCANYLRVPLDALCDLPHHNKGKPEHRLKCLKLTPSQWTIFEQLESTLMMLDNCTNHISKLKYPLLHEVIPMMDKIHGNLSKCSDGHPQRAALLDGGSGYTRNSSLWGKDADQWNPDRFMEMQMTGSVNRVPVGSMQTCEYILPSFIPLHANDLIGYLSAAAYEGVSASHSQWIRDAYGQLIYRMSVYQFTISLAVFDKLDPVLENPTMVTSVPEP
ncbi:hypothetical protein BDZ89DRAFT_1141865 [Hymenopellis radicata]|nr:hypothetical protein BDZ89DRAFT_1141865 [Hymenopellis radicata]